jgi:hypothetical protein
MQVPEVVQIPEAVPGSAPGLEIAGHGAQMAPASVGGRSKSSVATTLSDKGLAGVPIAVKCVSNTTGKPYYRYRNSAGSGYYISEAHVKRLGVVWYPNSEDPTKGVLKNPTTGAFVSHAHARTQIGSSVAGSDVANLRDIDELPGIDEDFEIDEEAAHTWGAAWFIRMAVMVMILALAWHTFWRMCSASEYDHWALPSIVRSCLPAPMWLRKAPRTLLLE